MHLTKKMGLTIIYFSLLGSSRGEQLPPAPSVANSAEARIIESLPEHLLYIYTREPFESSADVERQLSASKRRWEPGRTLRVCLFGGNQTVAKLIRNVATEWNRFSGVKFDFGPQNGWYNCLVPNQGFFQIRIGFSERGYWSAVGNDAETRLAPLQPSMNFENFNIIYSDLRSSPQAIMSFAKSYDLAVIRHEFGHALGLLHEHQNPALGCFNQIRWSGPGNVYEFLARPPNGWSTLQVDRNLGYVQTTDPDYDAGEPDLKSIMMYSLPPEIFKNGASSPCATGVNFQISDKDSKIIQKIYPVSNLEIINANGELDIKTASVSTLPAFVDASNRTDLLTRIKTDLDADDKFVRRDARARLADLLQKGMTGSEIQALVMEMPGASYRFQLGVANALAHAKASVLLTPTARNFLSSKAGGTTDKTLKKNLLDAIK